MSFKILYQEGNNVQSNLASVAVYIDSFAKNLGLDELSIDPQKLTTVAAALVRPDFPHVDGLEKASPFKKAANFFVWFVAARPILNELPEAIIGKDLKSISNHQNVIFAYHMAIDCLHGAELHRKDKVEILSTKIKVSQHFFIDFVEAYSAAAPVTHFQVASLLFEQLAYKYNKDASYPEII
jgi:hypothetical protein